MIIIIIINVIGNRLIEISIWISLLLKIISEVYFEENKKLQFRFPCKRNRYGMIKIDSTDCKSEQ